ncbi:MAG: Asp/Glu/hydantoin racemase, partial [Parasporobacterium sp.]|nr:Asp/Glu/hydantoin racemase [Parasporobacterium sp.]
MKKVAVIHTSEVTLSKLKDLFAEIIPDVEMINIIDDSLLAEVKKNGHITPHVTSRVCEYAKIAQDLGACMILNQCSSVGEACSVARNLISIPYLKIDEPMDQKAVELGSKIAVIGTVASTMGPSCRLVEEMAQNVTL